MSRWFPDLSTADGIKAGFNGGAAAAIGFGCFSLLGLAVTFFRGHMPGVDMARTDLERIFALGGIALEATLAFVAAYRFTRRKGLWIGTIALLLFLLEIYGKIATGSLAGGWIFAYAMILLGLINGLRAAWAARTFGPLDETDLESVFE